MSNDNTAHEQEVSLLDQMKYVTYGHTVGDVMLVAVTLLMQSTVQRSTSKKQALRALDCMYIKMAEEIDQNYELMLADTERAAS